MRARGQIFEAMFFFVVSFCCCCSGGLNSSFPYSDGTCLDFLRCSFYCCQQWSHLGYHIGLHPLYCVWFEMSHYGLIVFMFCNHVATTSGHPSRLHLDNGFHDKLSIHIILISLSLAMLQAHLGIQVGSIYVCIHTHVLGTRSINICSLISQLQSHPDSLRLSSCVATTTQPHLGIRMVPT